MAKKKSGQPSGWDKLVESVQADDGLPTRDSGFWAEDKLWHWNRYVEITTRAMGRKWPGGLVYVDLFCGPGVCFVRNSKRRIPGSPLIAANAPKPFSRLLLCDIDPKNADACESRLKSMESPPPFKMYRGDCNVEINAIVSDIPSGALTLAFLDPTGLHLDMETVRKLSKRGAVDLLILFPDAVDVVRNLELYFQSENSKLDLVLGQGSNWKLKFKALGNAGGQQVRELFEDIYIDQLKALAGYKFFGSKVINGDKGPLYKLVYASKDERGLDFWNKSIEKGLSGQLQFRFE
jgi:three-Cys-motif partner protein